MKIDKKRLWKASKPMVVIMGISSAVVGLFCVSPLLGVVIVGISCIGIGVFVDYTHPDD